MQMSPNRRIVQELAQAVHESNLEVFRKLSSDLGVQDAKEGLSMNDVENSLEEFGRNILPQTPTKSFLHFVLAASQDRILILLAVAAIISLALHWQNGGWIEGVAILAAVAIVISVNAVNDWKKDQLFQSLNRQSQAGVKAKVVRSGLQQQIPASDLVIFDHLLLEPGVRIKGEKFYFIFRISCQRMQSCCIKTVN